MYRAPMAFFDSVSDRDAVSYLRTFNVTHFVSVRICRFFPGSALSGTVTGCLHYNLRHHGGANVKLARRFSEAVVPWTLMCRERSCLGCKTRSCGWQTTE